MSKPMTSIKVYKFDIVGNQGLWHTGIHLLDALPFRVCFLKPFFSFLTALQKAEDDHLKSICPHQTNDYFECVVEITSIFQLRALDLFCIL